MVRYVIRISARLAVLCGYTLAVGLAAAQVRDPRAGYSAAGSGSGSGGGGSYTPLVIEVDTVAELVAAFDAATASGGGKTIALAPLNYAISAPLKLNNCERVSIIGNNANILPDVDDPKWAGKFLIEMQGADHCSVTDLWLRNPNVNTLANMPAGGLLVGRTDVHPSGGRHYFKGLLTNGKFKFSGVVNVCSEINHWDTCYFENYVIDATKPAYAFYMSQPKAGGDGAGPIDPPGTFTLTGPALFTSTMSGQTFTNCNFARISDYAVAPHVDDATICFDNTANGSFGNLQFTGCWFNGNSPATPTQAACVEAAIRIFGGDWDTDAGGPDTDTGMCDMWGIQFESCVSEFRQVKTVMQVERRGGNGVVRLNGLRMINNHWNSTERLLVGGNATSIEGAVIADDGFTPTGGYDWGYNNAGAPSTADGSTRCLIDIFYGGYNYVRMSPTLLAIMYDPNTYGVRSGANGGSALRPATDARAWSVMRQRGGISNQSTLAGRYLTDILPYGVGGSQIDNRDIKSSSAGIFSEAIIGGEPGGGTTVKSLVVKRDAIPSATATPVFRIDIPTGNQSAFFEILVCGHTDNYDATGTIRGVFAINRQATFGAVVAYATLAPFTIAAGAGPGTDTFGTPIIGGAVTGATSGAQTIDVTLSANVSAGGGPWTAYVLVRCVNANGGGITFRALEQAGIDIASFEPTTTQPANP